jgi:MFS transporter, DHA1 family, inner membrane transport protein
MFTRQEKIILGLCAAINFTHIVDFMIMMPLGPQLMRIFSITPHQFGLLVSVYTFAAAVSGLLVSFYIDRFDRKKALLATYIGFALGTIACAISKDYHFLLFSRILTGAFGGVLGSMVLSVTSDAISVERRGTAMGIVMGSFSIASVFGLPIGLYIANHYDWHAPFMFLGVLALVLALVISWVMPAMRGHLRGRHAEASSAASHEVADGPLFAMKHMLQSKPQLIALTFSFCLVFGQFSIIPFLSPSFVANGGLTEAQLPLIYLFGGLASMIFAPLCGRLADIYGRKKIFYVGAIFSMPVMIAITTINVMPTILLVVISTLFFIAMTSRMIPAMALMSSAASPRYRGSFMSVNSSVHNLSAALASYVSGNIIVKSASGQLINYPIIGWVGVIFTCLSLFFIYQFKPVEY